MCMDWGTWEAARRCRRLRMCGSRGFPQRLKPASFGALSGTTEVVTFPNAVLPASDCTGPEAGKKRPPLDDKAKLGRPNLVIAFQRVRSRELEMPGCWRRGVRRRESI